MAPQNRMMTLVAFLQAQNCSNLPGSWRHPSTMLDFTSPEYYQRHRPHAGGRQDSILRSSTIAWRCRTYTPATTPRRSAPASAR